MGKTKSAKRSVYERIPLTAATLSSYTTALQNDDEAAYNKSKYVGRRVYIFETEDGAVLSLLKDKTLLQYGRINRLEVDGPDSMIAYFATQSSATACVRDLDPGDTYPPKSKVVAFCMDWTVWCHNKMSCKYFDCICDHVPEAECIQDARDLRTTKEVPYTIRQLLLEQHHSSMPTSFSPRLKEEVEGKSKTVIGIPSQQVLGGKSKSVIAIPSQQVLGGTVVANKSPPVQAASDAETAGEELRQLQVHGSVGGIGVTAIPDFGSGFDIMSAEFALSRGFTIDRKAAHSYTLPSGKVKQFLGTVTAEWCFDGESDGYKRTFHVLQGCVHRVLLGKDILKATQTLSRHMHRVKVAIIKGISSVRRLLLVDSLESIAQTNERMLGLINGRPVPGFADTCSDIPIIRRSVAKTLGLKILEGPAYRVEVEFVDGSRAFTTGIVKNVQWCFSASLSPKDTHVIDFHIMDDIPCAVILDKWLLWDNRAFVDYHDCFFDVGIRKTAEMDPVCLIQVTKSKTDQTPADPVDIEAARRAEEDDRIDELPLNQQAGARAAETRRRQEWDRARASAQTPALAAPARSDPLAAPSVPPGSTSSINRSPGSPARVRTSASRPNASHPSPPSSSSTLVQSSTSSAGSVTRVATASSSDSAVAGPSNTTINTSDEKGGWTTVFRKKNRKKSR